jgi:hypothetical protein
MFGGSTPARAPSTGNRSGAAHIRQNVYAMRPEVRAGYEAALERIGDTAFLTRFERFFTQLRDPLFALYGDDPRFPERWEGRGCGTRSPRRWVWTTFHTYRWDLDHANPDVFVAVASAMLDLAAAGVDVLRLDAAPFMWKREGTNCQNQPEVHDLLQAFRAVFRIATPGVAFKAEAIVAPRDLVPHLGTGRHASLPLIHMGDELGLRNDDGWAADPAHTSDNRRSAPRSSPSSA